MTSPAATDAPAGKNQSRSWGDIAFHLAGMVAAMPDYDRGGFAGLRRMDPDDPGHRGFLAVDGRRRPARKSCHRTQVGADPARHRPDDTYRRR